MFLTSTVLFKPKEGSTITEWEDFIFANEYAGPDRARFIVGDGATEAYDSLRWGRQLIKAFREEPDAPGSDNASDSMRRVFEHAQRQWVASTPASFANIFEERKFHDEGSFATVLSLALHGLDNYQPRWYAASLGDTILFHIRNDEYKLHFPPMSVDEFGRTPNGASTSPAELDRMCDQLQYTSGTLAPGDRLFVATDALAAWLIRRHDVDGPALWSRLSALDSDPVFAGMIDTHRGSGELDNDDVTLLRIEVADHPPDIVVVSQ
jgi:hypothetical protein